MNGRTYGVGTGVLLLSGENTTAALSSIESALSADDGLALGVSRSTDLGANLGNVVPVLRHVESGAGLI